MLLPIPTPRPVFWQMYDGEYLRQPNDEARYAYRRNHPAFDAQGVAEGLWSDTVATLDRRADTRRILDILTAPTPTPWPTPDFSGLEPTR